jgi:adenine deaminase
MQQTHFYHHLIDIENKRIFPAEIIIAKDKIISIKETDKPCENYILPGFIDAHVHVESSMLIPSEFARLAVNHGTVATISDPHEIANVCGIEGVEYMIENAAKVPFKFHFGAPSCVPATSFETAGDVIDSKGIEKLLQRDDIYYLSEMMNYPGVLFKEDEVMKKIEFAQKYNKPVDGHAPGLRGEQAKQYIDAGISTDHECFTKEEAEDKLKFGMKILIREGSAAKNFDALIDLLDEHYENMMFCCDDKHPDELVLHHINLHVKRALANGNDLFKVLQVACINPVKHYKMHVGLLKEKDSADFIVVDNLADFSILKTVINGNLVSENGIAKIESIDEKIINRFNCNQKKATDFKITPNPNSNQIKVIEALEGQLITKTYIASANVENENIVSDIENDVLKIAVVNRYVDAPIAVGFIKNFNLKAGAIASTVAHDSHNIIAVGINDEEICNAVNELVKCKGGVSVVNKNEKYTLPLPVAGLMSNENATLVAAKYASIDKQAKALGCSLNAPFMTLSFMALLVIPQLKLSDKGLFDGGSFQFVDLFEK